MWFHTMGLPNLAQLCLSTGVGVGAPEPLSDDDEEVIRSRSGSRRAAYRASARAMMSDSSEDDSDAETVANSEDEVVEAILDEIRLLVPLLRKGTKQQKETAAYQLGRLALEEGVAKAAIAAAGGIPSLVALVRDGTTDEQEENAAFALSRLAYGNDANKAAIAAAGGIPPLVALVRDGTEKQKNEAANALANLAGNNAANSAAIAAAGGIPPLVALVRNGSTPYQADAADALANLAYGNDANKAAIAAAGGIPPLVALMHDGTTWRQKNEAARALLRLTDNKDWRKSTSVELRLLVDAATGRVDCDYWEDTLPKFTEVRDAMQNHGQIYDFLAKNAKEFDSRCDANASFRTLSRMLQNFKILGAAATAQSNPSTLAAKTLLKLLLIEVDEVKRSHVWANSKALLSKTMTLLKYSGLIVASGAVGTVSAGILAALLVELPAVVTVPAVMYNAGNIKRKLGETKDNLKYKVRRAIEWAHLKRDKMDTPEFRAMEEANEQYNDKSLRADLEELGLNEIQTQQAQRFEHWLAITGTIASRFNAAAEAGDADANVVLEVAEAFIQLLTAPTKEDGELNPLHEIDTRIYAVRKGRYFEKVGEEQTIEEQDAQANGTALRVGLDSLEKAERANAQGMAPDVFEEAEKRQAKRQKRELKKISASLADFFGDEKVVRLQLCVEDLHLLLAPRYGSIN